MALCMDSRLEVNNKRRNIKGENKGDDPFKNGGDVILMRESSRSKYDGEDKLDENKGKFDPKGRAKDAMFAVF